MRDLIIILLLMHGLIHLFGFSKVYRINKSGQLTHNISRFEGLFWLLVSALFLAAGILHLLEWEQWLYLVLIALVFSQILIFRQWFEARLGTIVNFIIIIAIFANFSVK